MQSAMGAAIQGVRMESSRHRIDRKTAGSRYMDSRE